MKKVSVFLLVILLTGCISQVDWVQRTSSNGEKTWVAICPDCKEASDYDALQCKNPDCRIFLSWKEKKLYRDFEVVDKNYIPQNSLEEIPEIEKSPKTEKKSTKEKPTTEENPKKEKKPQEKTEEKPQKETEEEKDPDLQNLDW